MSDIFDEMKKFEKEMDMLIESFMHPSRPVAYEHVWIPAVNIFETNDELIVLVEAAGVRPEDIKVLIKGSKLQVTGVRDDPFADKGRNFHAMEIDFGEFNRTITIPVPIDEKNAKVENENGFLKIILPKKLPVEKIIKIE